MRTLRLIIIAMLCALPIQAQRRSATKTCAVDRVYDGDNISCIVRLGRHPERHNLRIAGIDAPEVKGHQPGWQESRDALRALALGQAVEVTIVGRDTKWHRNLTTVVVTRDGRQLDLGLEQLKAGNAWFYRQYSRSLTPAYRATYAAAEAQAMASKRGLFAEAKPIPPWQWRRAKR